MNIFSAAYRINSDEGTIFQKMMRLVIKNDYLERELKLTRDLLSKGVLDSHSYIVGFKDGKLSREAEIEVLKTYKEAHKILWDERNRRKELTDEEMLLAIEEEFGKPYDQVIESWAMLKNDLKISMLRSLATAILRKAHAVNPA